MSGSSAAKPKILLIEDNREIRLSARFVLEDAGFNIAETENPVQAMSWLAEHTADLLLLDMNFDRDTTSGMEGLRFLRWLQQQGNDIPVIAMTAWSNTELVVQAMQLGAGDFIEKPWHNQRLIQVMQQQLKLTALQRDKQALQQQLQQQQYPEQWQSPRMQRLMQQLQAVADTRATVLLTGENGTGKSQLALWLHQQSSQCNGPFVAVNMAAIPDTLFEAELFGFKKGAFTDARQDKSGRFALARNGSLFLDEIGCLPLAQQSKLLRVLESGEFEALGDNSTQRTDHRLICATNADIDALIGQGLFRQDLYFRLNTLEFEVPPLRQRLEDLPLLSQYFLHKHGSLYQKPGLSLTPAAEQALRQYHWPGNIRELSHLLERAVLLCGNSQIDAELLQFSSQSARPAASMATLSGMTLAEAELFLLQQALQQQAGNKQKAADQLGITKSSLYRRLEKYGLAY